MCPFDFEGFWIYYRAAHKIRDIYYFIFNNNSVLSCLEIETISSLEDSSIISSEYPRNYEAIQNYKKMF